MAGFGCPPRGNAIAALSAARPRVSPMLLLLNEIKSMFSPDGRRLAYVSAETGLQEVYVRPFPGPGGKWQSGALTSHMKVQFWYPAALGWLHARG